MTDGTRTYHHGDLRRAMIEAAEAVLAERGVAGFTLRECARRAGVSSGAPAHHFGNVMGLLTAIAAIGFDGLTEFMQAAEAACDGTDLGRLMAIGDGYISFALTWPERFRVMFGRVTLDKTDPAHLAAGRRAYGVLTRVIGSIVPAHEVEDAARFAWSVVHGFSTLALDARLDLDLADAAAVAAAKAALCGRLARAFDVRR